MILRIFAPAKVNLHLAVGAPGPDGYHPVETVLQALALGDTVTIAEGGQGFSCTPDLGLSPDENLAWRAARAMSGHFSRPLDVAIAVDKRVPAGAGLGGASSDAAAVIVGLARLWGLEDAADQLAAVARSLGADVAFFLEGGAALYGGRGDVLAQRLPSLDAAIVVAKPAEPVPTAQAYAAFDRLGGPAAPAVAPLLEALDGGGAGSVARHLYNAMTPASISLVPAIADALGLVGGSAGVLGAAVAGSGSAVFGISADTESAQSCAVASRAAGLWAVATTTYPGGCTIEGR